MLLPYKCIILVADSVRFVAYKMDEYFKRTSEMYICIVGAQGFLCHQKDVSGRKLFITTR